MNDHPISAPPEQKKDEPQSRQSPPGGAETGHRKPLRRGEPFQHKNSLVNWSPR